MAARASGRAAIVGIALTIGLATAAAMPAVAAPAAARPAVPRPTYANPIDIAYRYNIEQRAQRISYRTGADPAIVRFKGAYYLFETLADGYWRSTDLVDWRFVRPSRWPAGWMVAPAVWADARRLYIMPATMRPEAIYVTGDPASGHLDLLTPATPSLPGAVAEGAEATVKPGQVPPGPWDPALFRDDDGRWYLYWGSSNVFPLYGIELDPTHALAYRGMPRPLVALDPAHHGWERFGQDHDGLGPGGKPVTPFLEGAWMTKVRGTYYLQYAAPGTEYNVYANGTYTARSPLGPFTYAPYNPIAYKPGGFVQGAGHGSTFQDAHGNWWNTGTSWIGYNWTFERRITMFPARFYRDGQMAVSTRFGDWPHYMPKGRIDDPDALFTGWMLLSYRKPATASSTLGNFAADRATDEDPRTFWVAGTSRPGQTLTIDLGTVDTVRAVQVNFADYRSDRYGDAAGIYTAFRLQRSADGRHWRPLAATGPRRRDRPNAYFALRRPVLARFVRYVHGHVGAATLAIADLRVFGTAPGRAPPAPDQVSIQRGSDRRDARIGWRAVAGATGYNVRWGIRPDRLTLTYQLFADGARVENGRASLSLRALDTGRRYWFAVEAFNETGVSAQSTVSPTP